MLRMWPAQRPSHALCIREKLRREFPDLDRYRIEDSALDFDLSMWWVQFWADGRKEEQVLIDPPKSKHQKVPVSKYRTWEAVLGLDQDEEETEAEELTRLDVEDIAADLVRNPDPRKLQAFLSGDF